jgi:putative Ca2+/H+ antiporter (TMEM165/GDT1 family)
MESKLLAAVFTTVFVAELGDKTQLATLLYAADARNPKLTVFVAAGAALVLASAVAVVAGSVLSRYLHPKLLSWIAGLGFVSVGIWTLLRAQ